MLPCDPADYRTTSNARLSIRLNDLCRTEQARPEPRHQYQEFPVTAPYSKTRLRTSQGDAELMAKKQILGFQAGAAA